MFFFRRGVEVRGGRLSGFVLKACPRGDLRLRCICLGGCRCEERDCATMGIQAKTLKTKYRN